MNKKTNKANAVVARGRKNPLRSSGGSKSEHWNNTLVEQAGRSVWLANSDAAERNQRLSAMIAAHNASMECYRRAMIDNQTFEGRRENLNQANKLSRTWATLLEALNRHRGKGQQKVTVEHVNVHSGGQAVVGIVEGGAEKRRNNPMQSKQAMQLSPRGEARKNGGTTPSKVSWLCT